MARNQNKPNINGDKSKQANNKWFEIKRIKKPKKTNKNIHGDT